MTKVKDITPKEGDYIIVYFVDEQSLGQKFDRTRDEWPLHITLLPWFSLSRAHAEQLPSILTELATSCDSFSAIVGPVMQFGPDKNIAVNVINEQSEFRGLHSKLVQQLSDIKTHLRSTAWVGDNYNAHITRHPDAYRNEDELIQVKNIHLVRLCADNICEIEQSFSLKETA